MRRASATAAAMAVALLAVALGAEAAMLRRRAPTAPQQRTEAAVVAPAAEVGVVFVPNGAPPAAADSKRASGFPSQIPPFAIAAGTAPPTPPLAAAASPPVVHLASVNRSGGAVTAAQPGSFAAFYSSYTNGPGIWKWSNAITAYDRFFAPMAGQPLKLAEVGVQSGGSIVMWKSVLGAQLRVYGVDINPATNKFSDSTTQIVIGDQADAAMWWNFFSQTTAGPIDILIDDGGHEAHQMLVTLSSVFDNLTPGGVIAIEDIHGEHYVDSFFVPAARYLAAKSAWGQLASVHVYPYLLLARRAGNDYRIPLAFQGSTETVREFADLWAAIPRHYGGYVVLENPGWGPFLTEQGLINFFKTFGELHHAVWSDNPPGCRNTAAALCTVSSSPGAMQSVITAVHIFPTRLVVEVAGGPVTLNAVRHGTEWLPY